MRPEIETLYRRRYLSFRNVVATITGDRETARDVVQEAFTTALKHQADFRAAGSLDAWVWRIAVRIASNASKHTTRDLALEDLPAADFVDASIDPELSAAVRALPTRRRLVVFLRYFADLPYAEIAEICGISEGTVAATIAAAHRELQQQLTQGEHHVARK